MKIIFLHIPKTAGQSVHTHLETLFGDGVCPARVNEQLRTYSISDLQKYRVFSGHFDWSLLDCIQGPKVIFTVLRDPVERILSFYFYLRHKSENMSKEELNLPQNQGLHAARHLSPDDYFCGGPMFLRQFLDDHYDNFYSYYFAGRTYRSRSEFQGILNRGELTKEGLVDLALNNIKQLDHLFRLDQMGNVFSFIRELHAKEYGSPQNSKEQYRVNVNNDLLPQNRMKKLSEYGATDMVFKKIEEWTVLDKKIWKCLES